MSSNVIMNAMMKIMGKRPFGRRRLSLTFKNRHIGLDTLRNSAYQKKDMINKHANVLETHVKKFYYDFRVLRIGL